MDTRYIVADISDLIYPDGTFGLLFIKGNNPIRRDNSLNGKPSKFMRSTFFGQKTKPINYHYSHGKEILFGIKIKPEGLPLFMSDNARHLCDSYSEICNMNNKLLEELEEKVLDALTIKEKINVIEAYIFKVLKEINLNRDYLLLTEILNYIKQKKGVIRFIEVTENFRVHYKKIERLFNFYLGVTPKTYMRIVRFNNSLYLHRHIEEDISLTQLGYHLGFFDQSHFIKEFKSFTSITPSAFFNKDFSESEEAYMSIVLQRYSNEAIHYD